MEYQKASQKWKGEQMAGLKLKVGGMWKEPGKVAWKKRASEIGRAHV